MAIHYDGWALRSYDEAGVGLMAVGPGRRPWLTVAADRLTGALGEFTPSATTVTGDAGPSRP